MARAKKFSFSSSTYGATIYGIIQRQEDGFFLDYADGSFSASPVTPYCPFTESLIVPGQYSFVESRSVWLSDYYTCTAYIQAGASPVPATDENIGSGSQQIVGDSSAPAPVGAGVTTRAQLLSRWRLHLDDTIQPYAWQDAELDDYGNAIIDELCRELYILRDSTTDAICTIPVTSGLATYDYSGYIIKIIRAKITGQSVPLHIVEDRNMDDWSIDWDGSTATGVPTKLIITGTTSMRLWPIPDANYTLKLIVFRLPIVVLSADNPTGTPDIPEKFVRFIDNGVYREAYSKHDQDTSDGALHKKYLELFEKDKESIRRMLIAAKSHDSIVGPFYGFV